MRLENSDYDAILSKIDTTDSYLQEIEYEKGNETLFLTVQVRTDGYEEDDYLNGTGAFVATDTDVDIDNVVSCNEDGDTDNDFDAEKLKEMIYEEIL